MLHQVTLFLIVIDLLKMKIIYKIYIQHIGVVLNSNSVSFFFHFDGGPMTLEKNRKNNPQTITERYTT